MTVRLTFALVDQQSPHDSGPAEGLLVAHNPKVAGSTPAPATTQKARKHCVSGPLALSGRGDRLPGCLPAAAAIARVGGVRVGGWIYRLSWMRCANWLAAVAPMPGSRCW